MPDIIQLLPDSIANQIAAGEVIQRPASLVKELLENSIDAGSTKIKLILKDAGKTLVQVIDDGSGMSEVDARMCFERHATSKIKSSEDLFTIRTKGFRGEALASIGAIAQLELRTKQEHEDHGRQLIMEGSKIKSHEAISSSKGTSIAVKNLFYNVPARRKFLKSDTVELKHILSEFQHVALAHPEIFFTCHHNEQNIYHLPASNLRQRIVNILGKNLNEKMVPIEENTDFIEISGFVGKPDYTKKTKADQFFFLNNRYIRSPYLTHAVKLAYESLIPEGQHPFFVIFMDIDPAKVDINVHPTKQEVKFEEERLVYNYIKVSVKHALGKYSITPTLDFELDFQSTAPTPQRDTSSFQSSSNYQKNSQEEVAAWDNFYKENQEVDSRNTEPTSMVVRSAWDEGGHPESELNLKSDTKPPYQIHNRYIISQIKNGFLLVDQHAAHERIQYERFLNILKETPQATQQALFPETIELEPSKASLLKEILPKINQLGFKIEEFGGNTFVIQGSPTHLENNINSKELIETFIEQYVSNIEFQLGIEENIARSLSQCTAIKTGASLQLEEMQALIDQLFACEMPYKSPSGKKCFIEVKLDDLQKRFNA